MVRSRIWQDKVNAYVCSATPFTNSFLWNTHLLHQKTLILVNSSSIRPWSWRHGNRTLKRTVDNKIIFYSKEIQCKTEHPRLVSRRPNCSLSCAFNGNIIPYYYWQIKYGSCLWCTLVMDLRTSGACTIDKNTHEKNNMLLKTDSETRLLIGWQHYCRPIRRHVRKSLLTNMDFNKRIRQWLRHNHN